MKKILILALLIHCCFNLSFAEEQQKLTEGLKAYGIANNQTNGHPYEITDINQLLDNLPELRNWMREEKYFDCNKFYDGLKKIIIKTWDQTVNNLLDNPTCTLDEQLKEKFRNNLKNDPQMLLFCDPLKDQEYPYPNIDGDSSFAGKIRIQLNNTDTGKEGQYLKGIIKYVLRELAKGFRGQVSIIKIVN